MNIILETFKLIRFQHWLKNLIIFIPIFFSKDLLDFNKFVLLLNIFIIFCLSSSLIYILNDIKDREADKNNAVKKI